MNYTVGEEIHLSRPVNRIGFICQAVKGKRVLDLGCWDETAWIKIYTKYWLHSELSKQASFTIGIDNSPSLPEEGVILDNSKILKGDCTDERILANFAIDIIVAGELIEHLPNTPEFLYKIKRSFPGRDLIITTPNATSWSNVLLGLLRRESTHIDHLNIYSYKTLNTLCTKQDFHDYKIIPYHVKYTEMILRSKGLKKIVVVFMEKIINFLESLFPLLSGGYIVSIKI